MQHVPEYSHPHEEWGEMKRTGEGDDITLTNAIILVYGANSRTIKIEIAYHNSRHFPRNILPIPLI